jgi:hypothetical protein
MDRPYWIAAATLVWASAANAAPALVQNIDEPIHNPYQQTLAATSTSCTAEDSCLIAFPPTTATETLILHASCGFAVTTGGTALFAQLTGANGADNILPTFAAGTNNGAALGGINTETYLFYTKGERPEIMVSGPPPSPQFPAPLQSLACTVSGYAR